MSEVRARKAELAFLARGKAKAKPDKALPASGVPSVGGQRVATPAAGSANQSVKKLTKRQEPVSPHPNAFKSKAFANSARSPVLNCGKTSPRAGLLGAEHPGPSQLPNVTSAPVTETAETASSVFIAGTPTLLSAEPDGKQKILQSTVPTEPALAAAPFLPASEMSPTETSMPEADRPEGLLNAVDASRLAEAVERISTTDLISFCDQLEGVVGAGGRMNFMPSSAMQAAAVAMLCSMAIIDGTASPFLDEEDLVDEPLPAEAWVQIQELLRAPGHFKTKLQKTPQSVPSEVVTRAASAVGMLLAEAKFDEDVCPLASTLQHWLEVAVSALHPSEGLHMDRGEAPEMKNLTDTDVATLATQDVGAAVPIVEIEPLGTPVRNCQLGHAEALPYGASHQAASSSGIEESYTFLGKIGGQNQEYAAPATPTSQQTPEAFDCDNGDDSTVNINCLKAPVFNSGENDSDEADDAVAQLHRRVSHKRPVAEERTSPFILTSLTRDVLSPYVVPQHNATSSCLGQIVAEFSPEQPRELQANAPCEPSSPLASAPSTMRPAETAASAHPCLFPSVTSQREKSIERSPSPAAPASPCPDDDVVSPLNLSLRDECSQSVSTLAAFLPVPDVVPMHEESISTVAAFQPVPDFVPMHDEIVDDKDQAFTAEVEQLEMNLAEEHWPEEPFRDTPEATPVVAEPSVAATSPQCDAPAPCSNFLISTQEELDPPSHEEHGSDADADVLISSDEHLASEAQLGNENELLAMPDVSSHSVSPRSDDAPDETDTVQCMLSEPPAADVSSVNVPIPFKPCEEVVEPMHDEPDDVVMARAQMPSDDLQSDFSAEPLRQHIEEPDDAVMAREQMPSNELQSDFSAVPQGQSDGCMPTYDPSPRPTTETHILVEPHGHTEADSQTYDFHGETHSRVQEQTEAMTGKFGHSEMPTADICASASASDDACGEASPRVSDYLAHLQPSFDIAAEIDAIDPGQPAPTPTLSEISQPSYDIAADINALAPGFDMAPTPTLSEISPASAQAKEYKSNKSATPTLSETTPTSAQPKADESNTSAASRPSQDRAEANAVEIPTKVTEAAPSIPTFSEVHTSHSELDAALPLPAELQPSMEPSRVSLPSKANVKKTSQLQFNIYTPMDASHRSSIGDAAASSAVLTPTFDVSPDPDSPDAACPHPENTCELAALLFPPSANKSVRGVDRTIPTINENTPYGATAAAALLHPGYKSDKLKLEMARSSPRSAKPEAPAGPTGVDYESTNDLSALLMQTIAPKPGHAQHKHVPMSTASNPSASSSSAPRTAWTLPQTSSFDGMDTYHESTNDLMAVLAPPSQRTVSKPAASQRSKTPPMRAPAAVDYESTSDLAALLAPSFGKLQKPNQPEANRTAPPNSYTNDDASEETMELCALLQPRSEKRSPEHMETQAEMPETGDPGTGSSGVGAAAKELYSAAGLYGATQVAAARRCFDGRQQWSLESARNQMPSRTRCCRLLQKVILAMILLAFSILIPVELAWRLGPEADDFY